MDAEAQSLDIVLVLGDGSIIFGSLYWPDRKCAGASYQNRISIMRHIGDDDALRAIDG